jgi:hypothetical protein
MVIEIIQVKDREFTGYPEWIFESISKELWSE